MRDGKGVTVAIPPGAKDFCPVHVLARMGKASRVTACPETVAEHLCWVTQPQSATPLQPGGNGLPSAQPEDHLGTQARVGSLGCGLYQELPTGAAWSLAGPAVGFSREFPEVR